VFCKWSENAIFYLNAKRNQLIHLTISRYCLTQSHENYYRQLSDFSHFYFQLKLDAKVNNTFPIASNCAQKMQFRAIQKLNIDKLIYEYIYILAFTYSLVTVRVVVQTMAFSTVISFRIFYINCVIRLPLLAWPRVEQ